jgi:hypothetical protein
MLKHTRYRLAHLALALCSAMPAAGAQDPTAEAQDPATVDVRVELVMPRYRDKFANRPAIETKVAKLFAEYLTTNVGFLRFAVNDTTLPYRLSFLLDRLDRSSTSSFAEVGFWVRLDRPGEQKVESYWLPFRTSDQSLTGVGTETEFVTAIGAKLAHANADSLRIGILRWVPITEIGLPTLHPVGIALPFPLLDLCMKRESTIQFVAELRGNVTIEQPFKAHIVGSFQPQTSPSLEAERFLNGGFAKVMEAVALGELTPSIAQKAVTVKKIFVTSYVHDPTACANRSPRGIEGGAP